jgi:hypothetical protein
VVQAWTSLAKTAALETAVDPIIHVATMLTIVVRAESISLSFTSSYLSLYREDGSFSLSQLLDDTGC